jgi:hypothetical protein
VVENLVDGLYEFDFNPCECRFVDATNWWENPENVFGARRWDLFRIYLQDDRGAPINLGNDVARKEITFLNNDDNRLVTEPAAFQTDGRDGILISKTPIEVLDGSKWYVQARVKFGNGDEFLSQLFDIGGANPVVNNTQPRLVEDKVVI